MSNARIRSHIGGIFGARASCLNIRALTVAYSRNRKRGFEVRSVNLAVRPINLWWLE